MAKHLHHPWGLRLEPGFSPAAGAAKVGRPTGFEPATPRSTILCSNQLSYDRRKKSAELHDQQLPCQPILGGRTQPPGFTPLREGRSGVFQQNRLAKVALIICVARHDFLQETVG